MYTYIYIYTYTHRIRMKGNSNFAVPRESIILKYEGCRKMTYF